MRSQLSPRVARTRGMTFLEVSVVITVLISLSTMMLTASRGWKRGSDRATCLINIRNMQMATRSYQNLYGYDYGGHPYAEYGTQSIIEHLHRKGYIEMKTYQHACGTLPCPGGGNYSCATEDVFPLQGELFLKCSIAGENPHRPELSASW